MTPHLRVADANSLPMACAPLDEQSSRAVSGPERFPLKLAVIAPHARSMDARALQYAGETLDQLLENGETWEASTPEQVADFDAAIVWNPCGHSVAAHTLSQVQIPTFALSTPLCFHPFHAAFEREVEAKGGMLLSAQSKMQIEGSLRGLRARKKLQGARLLRIDDLNNEEYVRRIADFTGGLKTSIGIEIVHLPVTDLLKCAAGFADSAVDATWAQLQKNVYSDTHEFEGEVGQQHLLQMTRLYLAMRQLLNETGCCGVTAADIQSFLIPKGLNFPANVMPNAAYGALIQDGYLACEEADIEVLASELLLLSAYGQHPTMSNIYLAYRDRFDALQGKDKYKPEMEHEDFEQCRNDNTLVAAHFSTSGLLPSGMRLESHLAIRETLPSWPGQSMVAATPKLGPVRLARLYGNGTAIHHLPAEVVKVDMNDSKGWYRGRWFLQVDSVDDFIAHCQHQHYAIGPRGDAEGDAAWKTILKLCHLT